MSAGREKLIRLLRKNYPAEALDFLRASRVTGPVRVPLDELDWSAASTWEASSEPRKVGLFAERMRSGKGVPPITLARLPGKRRLRILDGHHRALAARRLGLGAAVAYVADVPPGQVSDALEMHDRQLSQYQAHSVTARGPGHEFRRKLKRPLWQRLPPESKRG